MNKNKKINSLKPRSTNTFGGNSPIPSGVAKKLRSVYRVAAAVMIVLMFVLLATAMLGMPEIGDKNNPDNNEVARRYIENGLDETGAVNIVSGMILDYRAFDTFGESCVLFVATICVTIMLRIDGRGGEGDDEDKHQYTGINLPLAGRSGLGLNNLHISHVNGMQFAGVELPVVDNGRIQ